MLKLYRIEAGWYDGYIEIDDFMIGISIMGTPDKRWGAYAIVKGFNETRIKIKGFKTKKAAIEEIDKQIENWKSLVKRGLRVC